MELVPKAFVNVSLEHSLEKDCLIIKDKTNKFVYQLLYLDVMECGDPFWGVRGLRGFDSQELEAFTIWFRRNFLKIYVVPLDPTIRHPPPWRSPF